ncbi:hypothetical protein ABZ468_03700 [Streptomyces sp. NPDC005708]|uniref:hypothetical protein n=1 Tax=unclassified Streptomyces TaxID=2593676 RepID=UPI0033D3C3B3
MSEALDRVIEALAGASEDEVATVLAAAGASRPRSSVSVVSLKTPLPDPAGASQIVSEVEWV